MKTIIKQVHIVDPANDRDGVFDVLIEQKKIKKIAKTISQSDAKEINAKGLHLFPGLVDLHTHFREPGYEHKETIATGADAARAGGFVAAVSMPNTNPACDVPSIVETILQRADDARFRIFPCGSITKGREGTMMSEMADLKAVGCVAVSDDGASVADALLARRAMEYAAMHGLITMIHAEDKNLSKNGFINEGFIATKMGLRGIPNAAEDVMTARDIELVRLTGAPTHFQHVSTKRAVELIGEAKKDGLPITAEVTPHHIALTEDDIIGYNTHFKMNPPLRTREDQKMIIQGLKKGVIDAIATDHAPHRDVEKDVEFDKAPFGTIGLETALAVTLTQLYHTNILSLQDIVRSMSIAPQQILGVADYAAVKEGIEANLCLVDINKEWIVDSKSFRSKSHNSCFIGQSLKGKVVATVCQGSIYNF